MAWNRRDVKGAEFRRSSELCAELMAIPQSRPRRLFAGGFYFALRGESHAGNVLSCSLFLEVGGIACPLAVIADKKAFAVNGTICSGRACPRRTMVVMQG